MRLFNGRGGHTKHALGMNMERKGTWLRELAHSHQALSRSRDGEAELHGHNVS